MTQQINLIDESLRQGRDWAHGGVVLSVLTSVALVVLTHWAYEQWAWVNATKQVAEAEAAREASGAAAQQLAAQVAQLQSQLEADDQMRKAAAAMVDPPQNVVPRFEQLIAGLSSTMWLDQVEFQGGRGVQVLVNGLRQADLARYADGLSAAPAFAGLPIDVLSVERRELSQTKAGDEGETRRDVLAYYRFEIAGRDPISEPMAEGQP